MNDWGLYLDGTRIARVETYTPAYQARKVEGYLLDGTPYVQTIGTPAERPALTIVVESAAEKQAVDLAAAEGKILIGTYRDVTFRGWIPGAVKWSAMLKGKLWRGTLELMQVAR